MPPRLARIKNAVATILGPSCSVCGQAGFWPNVPTGVAWIGPARLVPLQVGHKNGRRWSIRRYSALQRWTKYLKEAITGKVQAECGPCNRKNGGGLRYPGKKDLTRRGARKLYGTSTRYRR